MTQTCTQRTSPHETRLHPHRIERRIRNLTRLARIERAAQQQLQIHASLRLRLRLRLRKYNLTTTRHVDAARTDAISDFAAQYGVGASAAADPAREIHHPSSLHEEFREPGTAIDTCCDCEQGGRLEGEGRVESERCLPACPA
jgi:hypothetical protein